MKRWQTAGHYASCTACIVLLRELAGPEVSVVRQDRGGKNSKGAHRSSILSKYDKRRVVC